MIFFESDSYAWLTYARSIARGEEWRVHYTSADNAPYGRPVHWSNSVSWLLVAGGWAVHAFRGGSLVASVELASIWLNACLLWLFALWLGWMIWRRMGMIAAILCVGYAISSGYVQWAFHPLRPDHQSLQMIFVGIALLGVALGGGGWVGGGTSNRELSVTGEDSTPSEVEGKRLFFLSGIATGAGFWISAAVQEVALLILVIAAGLALIFFAKRGDSDYRPGLWRLWGRMGALVSLGCYFLEYFPEPVIRLEVNNPIYSLSIWGAGEFLAAFAAIRGQGSDRRSHLRCWGWLVVALLPVGLILFGPTQWHAMRDPMMQRFHEGIAEFQGFRHHSVRDGLINLFGNLGILPVFLGLALYLVRRESLPRTSAILLWFLFAFAYAFLVVTYFQVRWAPFFALMNATLAAAVGLILWRAFKPCVASYRVVAGILALLLLLIQPIAFGWRSVLKPWRIAKHIVGSDLLVTKLMTYRLAKELGGLKLPDRVALVTPDLAPVMYYMTGIRAVDSYYWENLDGLRAATEILTSLDPVKAVQHLNQRKIDLICLGADDASVASYVQTGRSLRGQIAQTLAGKITSDSDYFPQIKSETQLRGIGSRLYQYDGVSYGLVFAIRRISAP